MDDFDLKQAISHFTNSLEELKSSHNELLQDARESCDISKEIKSNMGILYEKEAGMERIPER